MSPFIRIIFSGNLPGITLLARSRVKVEKLSTLLICNLFFFYLVVTAPTIESTQK